MLRKKTLAMAVAAHCMGIYSRDDLQPRKKEPDFDIDEEYELIQQKKSKLSANMRRWVVRQVENKRR